MVKEKRQGKSMTKVLLYFLFIAAISFLVAKYYWAQPPTDYKTISSEILSAEEQYCEGGVCGPPEEWEDK